MTLKDALSAIPGTSTIKDGGGNTYTVANYTTEVTNADTAQTAKPSRGWQNLAQHEVAMGAGWVALVKPKGIIWPPLFWYS